MFKFCCSKVEVKKLIVSAKTLQYKRGHNNKLHECNQNAIRDRNKQAIRSNECFPERYEIQISGATVAQSLVHKTTIFTLVHKVSYSSKTKANRNEHPRIFNVSISSSRVTNVPLLGKPIELRDFRSYFSRLPIADWEFHINHQSGILADWSGVTR